VIPLLLTFAVFPYALGMANADRDLSRMPVGRSARPSGRLWNPAADVYRTRSGWIVKVDLAGICADELEINLSRSKLHIRGSRRDTLYREEFVYHRMEITYSRFEKIIQFPWPIEGGSLVRNYQDGFLIIELQCEQDPSS
jgi:HSP20 family protein